MIVHWGQLLATVATGSGIAVAVAALAHPFAKRREDRKLAALRTAATLATVELRDTVTSIVTSAVDAVKADTIARIDESDLATGASFVDVKADVKDVAERMTRQEVDLARQFGGNGGGIRQAINEHNTALASLAGRFDQHIAENTK